MRAAVGTHTPTKMRAHSCAYRYYDCDSGSFFASFAAFASASFASCCSSSRIRCPRILALTCGCPFDSEGRHRPYSQWRARQKRVKGAYIADVHLRPLYSVVSTSLVLVKSSFELTACGRKRSVFRVRGFQQ